MSNHDKTYALAVETSGRVGSVALGYDDIVLYESSFSGIMRHSTELFDTLDGLLAKADIGPRQVGQIYMTAGPGSFTGIRIAVTLSKMVAYAIGTKIVAVNTLDALAENAAEYLRQSKSDLTRVAAILDAKQNRFFVSIYERRNDEWTKLLADSLLHPEEILSFINKGNIPTGLLGEGLTYYAGRFESPLTRLLDKKYWPAAARNVYAVGKKMAKQNQYSDPYRLVPIYIRKPDAVEKRENRTV